MKKFVIKRINREQVGIKILRDYAVVDRERLRGGSWSILGIFEGEMEIIWRGGCCRNECQDRDKSEWKGNGG